METKANPNPLGCYARALPHEPMFILLARDPVAPAVIRLWAERRMEGRLDGQPGTESDQIVDALNSAEAFEAWRIEHDGEWREAEAKRAAMVERFARRIAAATNDGQDGDHYWQSWTAEAAAVLDEFERVAIEHGAAR
jgi:hypothetical protein